MHVSLHFIEISAVVIPPDRMRREFKEQALADLQESIRTKGLLHPLTIEKTKDGKFILRAGERRFRAISALAARGIQIQCDGRQVPLGYAPMLYMTELSPLDILELELEENVIRENLTWQEQAEARQKLLQLRRVQHAGSYSTESLAQELAAAGASASSKSEIQRDILLARYMHEPEVRAAKSAEEATAKIKKIVQKSLTEALGTAMADAGLVPEHKLIVGDCLEELPKLPPNFFDLVLTDPPYGIDIQDSGGMVTQTHHYQDTEETLLKILEVVPNQLRRVTKANAHVYWFCDLRHFAKVSAALEDAGFDVCRYPIIWHKQGKSMAPDVTRWPKRVYECIVFANKGGMPTLKVAGDVIPTPYSAQLQQAEKPKELLVELMSRSVGIGAQVLDPFCGSGSIFLAAQEAQCSATGIELDPERAMFAKVRAYGEL